jgi:membrane protease YdiL (CAAX protease family)
MPPYDRGFAGRPAAIMGIAFAFGWILLFAVPGITAHTLTSARDEITNISLKWSVLLVLCIIAFAIRRWTPAELGIRPLHWGDALAASAAFVIAFVLSGVASRFVAMPGSLSDLHKLAAVPVSLRFGLVLTAALSEEFMYRGYGIEELKNLTGSYSIAGLLSLLIFTVSHAGIYGFSRALIVPGLVGAVLTGLYLWRRNLGACMLTHFLMDACLLIAIPAVVRTS